MCLGSSPPGAQDGRIVTLQFQARIHGHHTDDLVCHIQSNDGRQFRTLLQMKRTLAAREKDKSFAECVTAAWTDYQSEGFIRGQDAIFFVYDTVSTAAMKGAATICNWARLSATPEEFLHKVAAESFSNQANRNALAAIRKIADKCAERTIDNQELFDFVKHLNCLPHDLDQDNTAEHIHYLHSIRHALALVGESSSPYEIWSSLVAACVSANGAAATINFDNLSSIISDRLVGIFAGARGFMAAPYAVVSKSTHVATQTSNPVAHELARLSGLVETLTRAQPSIQDHLPVARDDSVNKLISEQLDGIHARIKDLRYAEGLEDLVRLGKSHEQFDEHQKARWYLLTGTCKWHTGNVQAAASDFIQAAELIKDEDKFAAAGIRGLLLQGNVSAAAKAGAAAMKAFPESLAVWQVTVNARINLGEKLTLEDIPVLFRSEADALQTLAWALHRQGDKAGAAQTAIQALDASNPSFFTRDTALSLCLEQAIGDGISVALHVLDANERHLLERCISEFSPSTERLWQVQSIEAVSTAVSNLAIAHFLLGRADAALALLHEARSHGVSSPEFLRVEMEALAAIGKRDEAIALGKSQIDDLSAEALAIFAQLTGEADDLESVERALEAANKLPHKQPGLVQNLTGMRWTILAKSDSQAVLKSIRTGDWAINHSVSELVAAAEVLRRSGFNDEAEERITRALELLPSSKLAGERYLVAHYLLFTRDYAKAAAVLEQIAPSGKHSQLHADLLFCYMRCGRRAKAKELIESFPQGWQSHAETRHLAMELAQIAGDRDLLAALVPVEFDQAPSEIRSWLLRVVTAAHSSAEEVASVLKDAPLDLCGSIQEICQLASLELRHGYKEQALRRLYVMRRNRLDSTESAAAHVVTLVAVTDELPLMEDELPIVGPGTAVTLTDKAGRDQTFTLDPTGLPQLPSTPEFLKAGSKEVSTLSGLVMGAQLAVSDALGESQVLTVRRICSAYRRLLELSQLALNSPLAPSPIARMMKLHSDESGKPDFTGLTRQLQQSNEHAKKTINSYSSSPITLGMLAQLLGRDVTDIVRGWPLDVPAIQVGGGNPEQRAQAIESLKSRKGPYLIDSVTLVELGSLDCLDALAELPSIFVTSHTADILEAKLEEAKVERKMGTAFEHEGKLGFAEVTAEQRQQEIRFFQNILDLVHQHCKVVPAYGTDSLPPIAGQIEKVVSTEEFSLILTAVEYEATLISMDARLRAITNFVGVSGVWPQVLLMYVRDQGKLSARSYSLATMRQLFANRTFISVTAEDLAFMAYQGTNWLKFGMSRFTKYLASPETEFYSVLRVSVDFIQRLAYQGPCHFGALCRILQLLSEGLFRHKDAPSDLVQRLFGGVIRALLIEKSSVEQKQLLHAAIHEGRQMAQTPNYGELKDVQVLMCSEVPLIAYVAEKQDDKEPQGRLISPAEGAQPDGDISPTYGDDSSNDLFR